MYRSLWGLTISAGMLLALFIFQNIFTEFTGSVLLRWLKIAAGAAGILSFATIRGNLELANGESKKLFRTFYNEERRLYLYKSGMRGFLSLASSVIIMIFLSFAVDLGARLMGFIALFAGIMTFLISFLSFNSK